PVPANPGRRRCAPRVPGPRARGEQPRADTPGEVRVTGRRLLRLYPHRWRDRYGDELAGLLDDLAADPEWDGPGPAGDVLRGAVDARLNFWRYPRRGPAPSPGWPPRAVLAGTGAVTLLIAVSLALYPANLRDPAAPAG